MDLNSLTGGIIVSILSGLYTSLWGAFKDSPYEDFKPKTFPRSIYFSFLIFIILFPLSFIHSGLKAINLFQLFFLVMGIERAFSEIYKAFFRNEDQAKYAIPSKFTLFGDPVESQLLRYMLGILASVSIFFVLFIYIPIISLEYFAMVALLGGILVSFGGAYKDAPFEGFAFFKFFRSPVVLLIFCPFFYYQGGIDLGLLIWMNVGLERFLVEYYKTYIQRNMSGKFKSDIQKITQRLDSREKFHYLAWVVIIFVGYLYIKSIHTIS